MQTGESEVGQQSHEVRTRTHDQLSKKREGKTPKEQTREAKLTRIYTSAGEHHRLPQEVIQGDLAQAIEAGKDYDHPSYILNLFGKQPRPRMRGVKRRRLTAVH